MQTTPGKVTQVRHWLDDAAAPSARVLDRLDPGEQATFLTAMDMIETELRAQDANN